MAVVAVFFQFMNKHQVLLDIKETDSLCKTLQSLQEVNQDLLACNSKLLARDRIKKLASEQLGMIFATEAPQSIGIVDDDSYRLIDFLVPTAEALTN